MELDFDLNATLVTDNTVEFDVMLYTERGSFFSQLMVSTDHGDDDTTTLAMLLDGIGAERYIGAIVHEARSKATVLLLERYVAERQVA